MSFWCDRNCISQYIVDQRSELNVLANLTISKIRTLRNIFTTGRRLDWDARSMLKDMKNYLKSSEKKLEDAREFLKSLKMILYNYKHYLTIMRLNTEFRDSRSPAAVRDAIEKDRQHDPQHDALRNAMGEDIDLIFLWIVAIDDMNSIVWDEDHAHTIIFEDEMDELYHALIGLEFAASNYITTKLEVSNKS